MNELILVIVILVLFGLLFYFMRYGMKKNQELKDLQMKIKNEEMERRKKDEAKEKIHTSDDTVNFNNSIDILQNLKKSK